MKLFKSSGTKGIILNSTTPTGTAPDVLTIVETLPLTEYRIDFTWSRLSIWQSSLNGSFTSAPFPFIRPDDNQFNAWEKKRDVIQQYPHADLKITVGGVTVKTEPIFNRAIAFDWQLEGFDVAIQPTEQLSFTLTNKGYGLLSGSDSIHLSLRYEYSVIGE